MGNWAPATSVTRTPNMVPANGNGQLPVPSPSNEALTMFALPARRVGTLIVLTAATLASGALSNAATVDSTSVVVAHAKLLDQTGARIGTAEFREDATGTVRIDVTVASTTPGLHGLHIHTAGSCGGIHRRRFDSRASLVRSDYGTARICPSRDRSGRDRRLYGDRVRIRRPPRDHRD